ncbi:MAG: PAS domain S-box protein [Anaerolineae bacterium]|nr:PAS domain S-box protein [Anaerolineae bacterium]
MKNNQPESKILIIDDEPVNIRILSAGLQNEGYTVYPVTDGRQAITAIKELMPDLVLLDVMMPEINGYQICEQIKAEPNIRDIPVIFVSALENTAEKLRAFEAGGVDYVTKPFQFQEVLARVETQLKIRHQHLEIQRLREQDRQRIEQLQHENTQRRKAETALRQERDRVQTYLDIAGVILMVLDPQGKIVLLNKEGYRILGYEEGELIGQNWFDIILSPPDRGILRDLFNRVIAGSVGDVGEYENPIITKTGEKRIVAWRNAKIQDDTGNVVSILSSGQDVTERRIAEQTVIDSQEQLELITDKLPALLAYIDAKQHYLYANQMYAEWYGCAKEKIVGLHVSEVMPEQDYQRGLPYIETVLGGKEVTYENTTQSVVKELRAIRTTYIPHLDEHGQVKAFLALVEDITENKRTEDALQQYATRLEEMVEQRTIALAQSKEQFETILNSSSDVIIMVGADGMIQQTNPAFERAFGIHRHDVLNRSIASMLASSQVDDIMNTLYDVIQSKQPYRIEVGMCKRDGTVFDADMALSPIAEENGSVSGVVCSIRDISQRKQMLSQLRQTLERQVELSTLKTRFIETVSHEFRTPLAIIQSTSELLKRYYEKMSVEQREQKLDRIEQAIQRMVDLLDDVLAISDTEMSNVQPRPTLFNLTQFCADIVREVQTQTNETHKVEFVSQGECEQAVMDQILVRNIVIHLLNNAIKFSSPSSEVIFNLGCDDRQAIFHIEDKGIGIPEAEKENLFLVFHRAMNVGTIPGTGLGLAIVKQSVELHGGTIVFDSEEGVGTSFTVVLPHLFLTPS